MNYDLNSVDRTQFNVVPHIIAGDNCFLVTPMRMGVDWTQPNKVLRSSVWNSDGELVSAGFAKFVNWGEKPDVFPVPTSLKNAVVVEKLDGSLLIVAKYKGEYIIRTRGTVDASRMEKNGHEIELFRNTILPKLELADMETWSFSVLFEWTSPLNKIVIDYGDVPQFKLVGRISHVDYSLWSQDSLDKLAVSVGLDRPETFSFDTAEELVASVEQWKGKEGVCVYSKGGQEIHKVKGADYLLKHRFKENATLENTLDLFVAYGYPQYQEFEAKLVEQFDHECFVMVHGFASTIVDAFKQVKDIEDGMYRFALPLMKLPRKDAAAKVLQSYGITNRANFVFTLLDGKPFGDKEYTKLMRQVLTK